MKKRNIILPASFIVISGVTLFLGIYLITTRTSLHLKPFITFCGEVLKNIQDHVHIDSDGAASFLIILASTIGVSLASMQIIRFLRSHKQLLQLHHDEVSLPKKLNRIVNKNNLQHISFMVTKDRHLTAYAIGLIRPRIAISESLIARVSSSQLEAIILHEFYHVRSRHVLWMLLAKVTSSLLFFVPLIKYLTRQLKIEFELEADSFVAQKQRTRNHICSALALNLKYANGVMPHFSTSPIERRVESLTTEKSALEKVRGSQLSISLLSIGFMLGLIFTQPNQATAAINPQSNLTCSIEEECMTTDCLDHLNTEEQYITPSMPAFFQLPLSY